MPLPNAYVTLLYSVSYLPGALVLGHSLKDHNNNGGKLVVLIPKTAESVFTSHQLHLLSTVYDEVIQVDLLSSSNAKDINNLTLLLKRPELLKTLTKLQIFQFFKKFDKILYLDSDLLVLQNLDHLFDTNIVEREILASPDSGWPDIFNSGFFLVKPSNEVYNEFLSILEENAKESSFDGADQGLLNEFFQKFGQFNVNGSRSWIRLPFLYNVTPTGQYQYNPAYQRFANDIKTLHFIGTFKPWHTKVSYYDLDKDTEFVGDHSSLTKLWWRSFYNHYGKDADIKSVIHNNQTNSFPSDFKVAKFDPLKNFELLSLNENPPAAEEATPATLKLAKPSKKKEPASIIDVMFPSLGQAERVFGPETF